VLKLVWFVPEEAPREGAHPAVGEVGHDPYEEVAFELYAIVELER
jgi:hypothetical protein